MGVPGGDENEGDGDGAGDDRSEYGSISMGRGGGRSTVASRS